MGYLPRKLKRLLILGYCHNLLSQRFVRWAFDRFGLGGL